MCERDRSLRLYASERPVPAAACERESGAGGSMRARSQSRRQHATETPKPAAACERETGAGGSLRARDRSRRQYASERPEPAAACEREARAGGSTRVRDRSRRRKIDTGDSMHYQVSTSLPRGDQAGIRPLREGAAPLPSLGGVLIYSRRCRMRDWA